MSIYGNPVLLGGSGGGASGYYWKVQYYDKTSTLEYTEYVENGTDATWGVGRDWSTTAGGTAITGILQNVTQNLPLYDVTASISCKLTVSGGYNGGATIKVYFDNVQVFTATANDTYNMNYTDTYEEISTSIGTVTISVTPPASQTGDLVITVTGPNSTTSKTPPKQGANTSYGYGNYSSTFDVT